VINDGMTYDTIQSKVKDARQGHVRKMADCKVSADMQSKD